MSVKEASGKVQLNGGQYRAPRNLISAHSTPLSQALVCDSNDRLNERVLQGRALPSTVDIQGAHAKKRDAFGSIIPSIKVGNKRRSENGQETSSGGASKWHVAAAL